MRSISWGPRMSGVSSGASSSFTWMLHGAPNLSGSTFDTTPSLLVSRTRTRLPTGSQFLFSSTIAWVRSFMVGSLLKKIRAYQDPGSPSSRSDGSDAVVRVEGRVHGCGVDLDDDHAWPVGLADQLELEAVQVDVVSKQLGVIAGDGEGDF